MSGLPPPLAEGTRVVPGTVLGAYFASTDGDDAADSAIAAGPGARCVPQRSVPVVLVTATRVGLVHWEANEASVLVPIRPSDAKLAALRTSTAAAARVAPVSAEDANAEAVAGPTPVAPTLRSTVHVRVSRVTRVAAFGDIIAVDGQWCGSPHALFAASRLATHVGALPTVFRASIRTEDVFRATGKRAAELLAAPMSAYVRPGDIVVGIVVALADARQFQVSLQEDYCGVVRAKSRASNGKAELKRIGEREAMQCDATGALEPRWAAMRDWVPESRA
jgi:exosome complex component CSL4